MTTKLAGRPAESGASRTSAAAPPRREPGRLASWLGGWRVAIRLARRDIRAHRGRSAVVMLMIGLPLAIMVAVVTLYASSTVTIAKAPTAYLGGAQARLTYVGAAVTEQSPDGSLVKPACSDAFRVEEDGGAFEFGTDVERFKNGSSAGPRGSRPQPVDASGCMRGAADVPGMPKLGADFGLPSAEEAAKVLGTWLGGTVVPVTTWHFSLGPDQDYRQGFGLMADARADVFRGMVELRSGRWPTAPGEVLVTPYGEANGLPTEGTMRTAESYSTADSSADMPPRGRSRYTVVGTADVAKTGNQGMDLVAFPATVPTATIAYLLDRSEPMAWSEVQGLGRYGIVATSRAVLDDPPHRPVDEIPGVEVAQFGAAWLLTAIMPTLAMLTVACLMAGPAFAIMAARQRRLLALVAANGAPAGQIRRTVLAEAGLLGVIAAALGVFGGIVVAVLQMRFSSPVFGGYGPLDVPLGLTLGIGAAGVLAALAAALVPARGLGRLDLVSLMGAGGTNRGTARARPARSGLAGVAMLLIGSVLFAYASVADRMVRSTEESAAWLIVGSGLVGMALLVAGGLTLVPVLLALLGRWGARLPLAPRLALRDASRLRGRATSTVAAIMAGTLVLSLLGILLATNDRYSAETYEGSAPAGMMSIHVSSEGVVERRASADAAFPGLRSYLAEVVLPDAADDNLVAREVDALPPGEQGAAEVRWVTSLVPAGCGLNTLPPWSEGQVRCEAPGISPWPNDRWSSLVAMSPQDAAAVYGLDAEQQRVLADGGAVVLGEALDSVLAADGTVRVVTGLQHVTGPDEARTVTWKKRREHVLPAVRGPEPTFSMPGGVGRGSAVLLTPATVRAMGVRAVPGMLLVGTASGAPLTGSEGADYAMAIDGSQMPRVEQGYQSSLGSTLWALSLFAALITLVATITATALSMGEARRDLATLGAVGARPGIRRGMAAAQAAVLALVGTVMGMVVGGIPGALTGLAISSGPSSGGWSEGPVASMSLPQALVSLGGGYVVVPWVTLLIALVAVPLVAAAFGALFAGRPVDMTRRAD